MSIRLTNDSRNALALALSALVEGDNAQGAIKIYQGSKPPTANDPVGGTLLATITLPATPFIMSEPSPGQIFLFSDLVDVTISASGVPDWGLMEDVDGLKILDFDIPSDLNIASTTLGGSLTISEFTLTMPEEC